MGETFRYNCGQCHYQKELFIGVGLFAKRLALIRREFDEVSLKPFEAALLEGAEDYRLCRCAAYCARCADIVNIPALFYTSKGHTETVAGPCPLCGKSANILTDGICCPRCGELMERTEIGLWD